MTKPKASVGAGIEIEASCLNCVYFSQFENTIGHKEAGLLVDGDPDWLPGLCRRHAPTGISQAGVFPVTEADNFCGDWHWIGNPLGKYT